LEDKIEAERQKKVQELKKSGNGGTKITPETFGVWQEKKRKQRAEKARKLVEAELRKKKGGKGLGVLSGRDLFEYKKDLFNMKEQNNPDEEVQQKEENAHVEAIAEKVQSDLFLEGDDDDLDDIEDD
jgi:hypothetical protein